MKTQVNKREEIQIQEILMIAFYVLLMAGYFMITGLRPELFNRGWSDQNSLSGQKAAEENSKYSFNSPVNISERMMNNLNEALIPIEESALNLTGISNIEFPVLIKDERHVESNVNRDLTSLLDQKNKEVAEECAIYWNVKECLKKESDKPLEIEKWMTNDAFWSFQAINAVKNN